MSYVDSSKSKNSVASQFNQQRVQFKLKKENRGKSLDSHLSSQITNNWHGLDNDILKESIHKGYNHKDEKMFKESIINRRFKRKKLSELDDKKDRSKSYD